VGKKMGRIYKNLSFISLQLLVLTFLLIQNSVFASEASGGDPAGFLSWGAGARSLGMGKAYTAVSDDASATYWNPAGLASISQNEIGSLYSSLYEDTTLSYFGLAYPTMFGGTYGINITMLSSGNFIKTDNNNFPVGEFSDAQKSVGLSYGRYFNNKLAVGISLKNLTRTLDNNSDNSILLDAGSKLTVNDNLCLALVMQNIFSLKSGDTSDNFPLVYKLGGALKLFDKRITLAADIDNTPATWHLGGEYLLGITALRAGFDPEEITLGMGLNIKTIKIDYAYANHQELGSSSRFSIGLIFGTNWTEKKNAIVESFLADAKTDFENYKFESASIKILKAHKVNEQDENILNMLQQTKAIGDIFGDNLSISKQTKIDLLIKEAVNHFTSDDLIMAKDKLIYALALDNSRTDALGLLKVIQKNPQFAGKEEEFVVGRNHVTEKLAIALKNFYEGDYELCIVKCEEILTLDNSVSTVYSRMGSAYWMLGKEENAKNSWNKALILDPNNEDLKKAINATSKMVNK
jgi:tetratricopeptide (TPR) repeat protein